MAYIDFIKDFLKIFITIRESVWSDWLFKRLLGLGMIEYQSGRGCLNDNDSLDQNKSQEVKGATDILELRDLWDKNRSLEDRGRWGASSKVALMFDLVTRWVKGPFPELESPGRGPDLRKKSLSSLPLKLSLSWGIQVERTSRVLAWQVWSSGLRAGL